MIHVRRLQPADANTLLPLRRRALQAHPKAFGEDLAEFDQLPATIHTQRLADHPSNAVTFGAFLGDVLVGMAGLYRRPDRRKTRHVASIFGMYVAPEARCKGAGRALLDGLADYAAAEGDIEQLALEVTASVHAARAMYERCGFVAWGNHPRSLVVAGMYYDTVHMTRLIALGEPT